MRVVVALGGNAILLRGETGTIPEQRAAIRDACEAIVPLCAQGHELVLTHGNGPQVGRLMLMDEALPAQFPPSPLDVLVAATQGSLGYLLQQEMSAALKRHRAPRPCVTLVTQTIVDPADPAFLRPTKPVGPWLSPERAAQLRARGDHVGEMKGGGWRRLVPSPMPEAIVEWDVLSAVLSAGAVPIVAGGGGIPVVREGNSYRGVPAVVDKDLAAAVVAEVIRADVLLILTDVEQVQTGYGTPDARALDRITAAEARAGVESGEFPMGSMGPKLLAAAQAAEHGARAVIAALPQAARALAGEAGTTVVA